MFKVVVAMLYVVLSSCASTTPEDIVIKANIAAIKASNEYNNLSPEEKGLADEIMKKIEKDRKMGHYLPSLILLIKTPYRKDSSNIKEINESEVDNAIEEIRDEHQTIKKESDDRLEEYLSIEEAYESSKPRHWTTISPKWFGPSFHIAKDDPLDILVHVNIHFTGDQKSIAKIILLEDAVEKHLGIAGFNINIVFTGIESDESFSIGTDPNQWPNSENFYGSQYTFAHELFHILGLPDEYDLITNHAGNPFITVKDRLELFLYQMDRDLPIDAEDGIMAHSSKRPLERHICAIAKLGDECIKTREKAFHIKEKR